MCAACALIGTKTMSTETSLKSNTNASGLAESTVQVETADEVRDLPLLPSSPARLDSTARRTSVLFAGERHHRGSVTATITNRLACEEAVLDQRLKKTLEEEDDEQDNTDQQQQHSMAQDTSVSDSATAADDTSTNTSLDRKRNRNSSMFMSETNMELEDLAAELAQAEQEYLQLSTTTSSNGDHQPDTDQSVNSNVAPSNDPLTEAMRMHEETEKEFLKEQPENSSTSIAPPHKPEASNTAVSNTDSPQKTQSTSSSIGDRKFIISDESNTTSSKPRRQTESGSSSLKKEADDESSSRPPTSRRLQPPLPERRWIVLSSGAMAGVVAGFLVGKSRKNLVSASQQALGLSVVLVASASLTYYANQRER